MYFFFPIWNQFVVPCPVLTVSSWPACRFLRRQVRWSASRITDMIPIDMEEMIMVTRWRQVAFGPMRRCSQPHHYSRNNVTLPTPTPRRQWHPTPALLPEKAHGRRSLVGCSPWGLLRVGHDWATSLSLFTFMHWRRKWQPTPVFLPGESQGRGSLVGCCLWGRTESDMTEATQQQCLIMTNSAEHFFFFFAIGIYLVKWLLKCFDICFFLLVVSLLSFQSSLF